MAIEIIFMTVCSCIVFMFMIRFLYEASGDRD